MIRLLTLAMLAMLAATVSARMAYELSAGYDTVLSAPLQTTFSCDDLPYGYYADTDNNCEVFHVCLPIADEIGALVETAHFSFICGNETVFSQDSLTCTYRDEAFPCDQARTLYDLSNAEFGRIPEKK
ncbi:U-scoloptoxin(01)-Cw1a-like [Hyalella azteca]|uniref:U-scoloptoxin(01)-Cw1a-like n=1 Tax=Hyalella azteca TaxID=294128 RepID=A0A8B7PAE7_HYAAZ|nr:U-scoloptoxin(01)-Cw1a-like [Hyalella azteca]